MARKALPIAVLVLGITALASARALYRVEVRGARSVLAQDQPVQRGSILLFHRFPDGRLVGVPQELVGSVEPAAGSDPEIPRAIGRGSHIRISEARVKTAAPDETIVVPVAAGAAVRPLEPGEFLLIGPTGSGSTANFGSSGQDAYSGGGGGSAAQAAAARAAVESQVFPGDLTTPVAPNGGGYNGNMARTNAYGAGAAPVLNPTLTGTASATPANSGPQSGTQPINPNGFPATTLNGPQSGTNPIGPNGFPATTTNGPQSGTNPIGPNGFPTTTGSPQPGAAQPVNPNGFPSTAQPGQTNTTPRTTTGDRASSARVTGTGNAVTIVPANGGSAVITNSGQGNNTTQSGTRATGNRAAPANGNSTPTRGTTAQPGTAPTTSNAPASSSKQ